MATDLRQQAARAKDSDFQSRIQAAISRFIPDVIGEPANTKGHGKRVDLMRRITAPGGFALHVPVFAWAVSGDDQILAIDDTAAITDVQLIAALARVFPALAGVEAADA